MGRRRLLVHVGHPKTGTTSLQRALSLERAHLLTRGILYPTATVATPEFGHHNIYWEAIGDDRFNPECGGLAEVLDEIRSVAPPTALISSEALANLIIDVPERFTTLVTGLPGYRTTVLIVVRRLDEYLESLFRHQFSAWVWDRPITRSTDITGFLDERNVSRAIGPLRLLLESGLDVVYLPYGPGMVHRIARALGFDRDIARRLTSHGDANHPWIGNRGIALIRHLVQRPDEEQLRKKVVADREPFRALVRSLGPPDGVRLMPASRATELLREAMPVYREVGRRFARAVVGSGVPEAWQVGSIDTEFTAEEVARIEAYFEAPVMADFG